MFTIAGRARSGYCDGVRRRDFLKIGGLALGGLSLPQLLQGRGPGGNFPVPQSGHHDLPGRRPAAPGHV